jgi:hypothetical protein
MQTSQRLSIRSQRRSTGRNLVSRRKAENRESIKAVREITRAVTGTGETVVMTILRKKRRLRENKIWEKTNFVSSERTRLSDA